MALAQTPAEAASQYKPQFAGDPARSESEAQALGYMRVVLRARTRIQETAWQVSRIHWRRWRGRHPSPSVWRTRTDRGDYMAASASRCTTRGFVLTMTPKQMDSEHRSFYAEEDGVIHADDQKAADSDSPKVK